MWTFTFFFVYHLGLVFVSCGYDTCEDVALYTCSLDYCTTSTSFELAEKGLFGTIPSSVHLLTNLASMNLAIPF